MKAKKEANSVTNQPPRENSFWPHVKKTFRAVWHRITHNWGWKVLSVLLAVCIWGVLVTQDDSLPRTKTFTNVKVSSANSTILKQNGYIVVDGLEDIPPVNITVQLPQKYYNTATEDRYLIRADLSQIKEAGVQELPLTATVTNPSLYGSVLSISNPSITVQVEPYVNRSRIPVQLNTTGSAPEGYYVGKAQCTPDSLDVAGPKSVVEKIVRCRVDYDLSLLTAQAGSVRSSLPYVFLDRDGNEVDTSLLTVTSLGITTRYVVVEQDVYATLELPVNTQSLIFGQPAEGYQVVSVKVDPEVVTIADDDLTLFQGENVSLYTLGRVNISGETQSKTDTITLNSRGAAYISHPTVTVTVEIRPVNEAE